MFCSWDECNLHLFLSIDWRASLVLAAAVSPSSKAYIKAVAVKALVVGLLLGFAGLPPGHVSGMAWAFV